MRGILALVISLTVAFLSNPVFAAQAPAASDPEVKKGIQLVDDGEYDRAILTLDGAARRLAASPSQAKDLAQAYLYLGIAYLAKGQEMSARVRFREAVKQARDLNLSPDKFAPKVIEEFERAREDVRKTAPETAQKGGGGAGKWLLIGGGAAAAGGAALVLAGGSSEPDPNSYFGIEGLLTPAESKNEFTIGPGGTGRWKVHLLWQDAAADVKFTVLDSAGRPQGEPRLVEARKRELEFDGAAGLHKAVVQLVTPLPAGAVSPVRYELNAEFPKP